LKKIEMAICDVLDELILPISLAWRVLRGRLKVKTAWWIMDTWWPFKKARRLRAKYNIWKDRRYAGDCEFHPSLNMNVLAMLELSESEQERYLEDLVRRRDEIHWRSLGRGVSL